MRYAKLERKDHGKARTEGDWPGVAALQIEKRANVFCLDCAEDILGEELATRAISEDPGYDHDFTEQFGNITAVLSNEEFPRKVSRCGHCAIRLDVKTWREEMHGKYDQERPQ